jgi:branched-chain amino acid transport system permease protein
MESFVNAIISGFISGSLYAAMAIGLTIIYGISRVFNFGHGVIALVGAYISWLFVQNSVSADMSLLVGVIVTMVVMFFFGYATYYLAIGPLMKKPNWEISTVLFMLGLGIMFENIILQIYGPRVKSIPVFVSGNLRISSVQINWHDLVILLVVITAIILLNYFFKVTRVGQAMRAVAQSVPGAKVVGINIERIFGLTFGLAFVVTALSGVLLSTKFFMNPHIGWAWMVKGFVIVCFGGLGSTSGAIFAALILGIVEALTTLYFGASWVWPVWFVIFIVILLVRPQGILGGRS